VRRALSIDQLHERKVARIVSQLKARAGVRPLSIHKKAVPHQVPKANDLTRRDEHIDASELTAVLHIDPDARICVAESGVAFVDLVEETLRYGLVPAVVPELKTITIGGAVSGCSLESMSFKVGGFHDTCLEYEVITATGEVLTARLDNEHRDVFEMLHGSFGTLGILSKLTFRLVPAKRFVHLQHEKYQRLADYLAAIQRRVDVPDVDFMDGIIHSPTEHVLSLGTFTDEAPYANRYDWLKVYYRSTAKRTEDFLATPHYFFRYDRGVTSVRPRSFLGRLLFGRLMTSTQWLWLGNRLHWLLSDEHPTITVDVFLPMSRVAAFFEWYVDEVGHFPLWCVPYKRVRDYPWLADSFWSGLEDGLFLDFAIYDFKPPDGRNIHRELEEKLEALGGVKTLISHNYYARDEFWSLFNKANYDRVKAKVDPHHQFRDLYERTCRAAMGKAA